MTAAAVGISHSTLIGKNDPSPEVVARVDAAVEGARAFIKAFDPDLVVLFAPDHYNGFFYKEMPPFCLATEAHSVATSGRSPGSCRSMPRPPGR
jgi:2,3-dihydroxyphenylpropionate 1,2-dioxygenase